MNEHVVVVGRSPAVLAETKALLDGRGYRADVTNRFDDVLTDFDFSDVDVVVFGGQVPLDQKADLAARMRLHNPGMIFVQGLAGIAGLIVAQVAAAVIDRKAAGREPARAPRFDPASRRIVLTLAQPDTVVLTAWWPTSLIPPDPKSDSLVLIHCVLPEGEHQIGLPDVVPADTAFVSVQLGDASYAFAAGG
jgi:hypothetical protein